LPGNWFKEDGEFKKTHLTQLLMETIR